MRFGARVANWGPRRTATLERLVANTQVSAPLPEVIAAYVELLTWCVNHGHGLGAKDHEADRCVAATALAGDRSSARHRRRHLRTRRRVTAHPPLASWPVTRPAASGPSLTTNRTPWDRRLWGPPASHRSRRTPASRKATTSSLPTELTPVHGVAHCSSGSSMATILVGGASGRGCRESGADWTEP